MPRKVSNREDSYDRVFYRPRTHAFAEDGTLVMEYSCYEGDSYLLGVMNCSVDDPDYNLWRWVLHESTVTKSIISNTDLESLRRDYAKTDFARGTKKLRDLANIPGAISATMIQIPLEEEGSTHEFELVLQYTDSAFDYFQEERLRTDLCSVVRGSSKDIVNPDTVHQTVWGGTATEHFIRTNEPQAAFAICKPLLAEANKLGGVIAAYRRIAEDSFVVMWPTNYTAVFHPQHQSDQDRRINRST